MIFTLRFRKIHTSILLQSLGYVTKKYTRILLLHGLTIIISSFIMMWLQLEWRLLLVPPEQDWWTLHERINIGYHARMDICWYLRMLIVRHTWIWLMNADVICSRVFLLICKYVGMLIVGLIVRHTWIWLLNADMTCSRVFLLICLHLGVIIVGLIVWHTWIWLLNKGVISGCTQYGKCPQADAFIFPSSQTVQNGDNVCTWICAIMGAIFDTIGQVWWIC